MEWITTCKMPELKYSRYFGRNVSDEILIVSEGVVYGGVIYIEGIGFVCMDDRGENGEPFKDITHWMEYPKPPLK